MFLAVATVVAGLAGAVHPAGAAPSAVVVDAFGRTSTSGWGSATNERAWSVNGVAADWFVSDGGGKVRVAKGIARWATQTSSARDAEIEFDVRTNKASKGMGQYAYGVLREQADKSSYAVRVRLSQSKAVYVQLVRKVGSTEEAIGAEQQVAGLTRDSRALRVRFRTVGANPATLKAKVWIDGLAEPSSWTIERTDDTDALEYGGRLGVKAFVSSQQTDAPVVFTFDDIATTVWTSLLRPVEPTPAPIAYGAVPLGTAAGPPPADAIYVAPTGDDAGTGTIDDPVRTINRAVDDAVDGNTIVVRAGTYREHIDVNKSVTIQPYPGEVVWISGADVVSGWGQTGATWVHTGWTVEHSRATLDPALTDPAYPLAGYRDMVLVDGQPLRQVATAAEVGPGTFFHDEAGDRLEIGTSPVGAVVEAAVRDQALVLRNPGITVRGIGVTAVASEPDFGAVIVAAPAARVEDVVVTRSASAGLRVQSSGAVLERVTASDNGLVGIVATGADDLLVAHSLAERNNAERFAFGSAESGIKVTGSARPTVTKTRSAHNWGQGIWFDLGVTDAVATSNRVTGNLRNGIQFEMSDRARIVSNLVDGNTGNGVYVLESRAAQIWNNSLIDNEKGVWIIDGARSEVVQDVTVRNNVISGTNGAGKPQIGVVDFYESRSAAAMGVSFDRNVYWVNAAGAPPVLANIANHPSDRYLLASYDAFAAAGIDPNGAFSTATEDPFTNRATLYPRRYGIVSGLFLELPADLAALLGVGILAGRTPGLIVL